ncbi:hypothetical protein SLEP1_g33109 [Rubroshorea leprosula]|uniref:Uncharacterized protein n=1 Tax=Rubroshorea leprosula TaxID=152421 RepID=A0AAV5KFR9_9ROSI|nr:hypothetical protein SLEP1_g33109 [Rubroshorea leprosula]
MEGDPSEFVIIAPVTPDIAEMRVDLIVKGDPKISPVVAEAMTVSPSVVNNSVLASISSKASLSKSEYAHYPSFSNGVSYNFVFTR